MALLVGYTVVPLQSYGMESAHKIMVSWVCCDQAYSVIEHAPCASAEGCLPKGSNERRRQLISYAKLTQRTSEPRPIMHKWVLHDVT